MFNQTVLEKIADFIKEKLPNGGLICVTGSGRSGKTAFASNIILTLGKDKSGVYPFDCLHTPILYRRKLMEKTGTVITGSHPNTVIKEMVWKTIESIKAGKDTPIYESEFVNENVEYKIIDIYKNKMYNIVEGLTAMHHSLWQLYDMVIFLKCSSEVELQRRLFQEGYEKNQSPEEIKKIFPLRRKQYEEYILKYVENAEIVIDTTDGNNPVVIFTKNYD